MSIPLSLNTNSVNLNINPNLVVSVPPVGEKSSVTSQQSARQDTTQFGQDKSNSNASATPQDAVALEWTDKEDVSKAIATAVQNSTTSDTKQSSANSETAAAGQTTDTPIEDQPEWSSFERWTPSGINMGTNLRELTNRLTVIWNFIDQNFTGEARNQLLSMLETLLSEKLQLVYQNYTDSLTEFFGNYGQQTAAQSVLDIIKEVVTSKTTTAQLQNNPKEAARLWDAANNPSDNRSASRLQSFASSAGRLPSLSSKNETLPFTLLDIQKATKFVKEITPAIQSMETESLQQALSSSPKQALSPAEAAKQLLPSLSSKPTAAASQAASSSPPGMAGLDLGLLSLKTEAFVKNADISPAMANALKTAVNQFLTTYSTGKNSSVSAFSSSSRGVPENAELPDKRLILLVNDRMAEEYRKSGNVDKSIQAGIQMVKNVYENHPEKELELTKKQPKALSFWEIIYLVKEKKDHSVPAEDLLNRLRNNWNGFVRTMELNKGNDTEGLIWNYYRSGLAESMLPKGLSIRSSRPTHLSLSSMFAASWFILAVLLVFIRIAGFPIPSVIVIVNLVLAIVFGLGVSFQLSPRSKDSDNISH